MAKKKSKKKIGEESEFFLEDVVSSNKVVCPGDIINNVYLKFKNYTTNYWDGVYKGFYYFEICDALGNCHKISMAENNQNAQVTKFSSFQMLISGLGSFMKIIQMNQLFLFSSVSLLVLEEIAKYDGGKDIHYYLKVLLEEPGKSPKIPKVKKKIPVCKKCDVMLLRYGFRWKIQRNDLKEDKCPYCGAKLEIDWRHRKLLKVDLNFEEEKCVIGGTRAQVGIHYNKIPINSTINAKGISSYLQNYQNSCENKTIGPVNIEIGKRTTNTIKSVKANVTFEKIEWRPVSLFPEDLVIF